MAALTSRVERASMAVAAVAMVATPLRPVQSRARARLATVTVLALTATTLGACTRRWGARRAGTALGVVAATTAIVEKVGTTSGMPFGRYAYTGRLRPTISGVPLIVALAWFAMGVPAREVAPRRRWWWGAAALTAWDLFLDPQMTTEGYWEWDSDTERCRRRDGSRRVPRYRGIPLSNYAGWFGTGAAVMLLLGRLLPVHDRDAPADGTLAGTYACMAVMSTLGFALFFGDPVVALVGGAAMLPFAVRGIRSWRGLRS